MKFVALLTHVDEIVSQSIERSNQVITQTQIDYLFMLQVFNASNDGQTVLRVNQKLLSLLRKPITDVVGKKGHEVL